MLSINRSRTPFFDTFFTYWTYFGDGWLLLPVFMVSLLWSYRLAFQCLIIAVMQSITSYTLKHLIFKGYPRPKIYFADKVDLDFIEGVRVNSYHSFPSGHTMTAFSIAAFCCLFFSSRQWVAFPLLIIAILAGLSRIYLLQHFYVDVVYGSLSGVLVTTIVLLATRKLFALEKWNKGLL